MFVHHGRAVLDCSMEDFEARYAEVAVRPDQASAARALGPMRERQVLGRSIMLFERADRDRLAALGEVRTPSLADLFVALLGSARQPEGMAA
jgi:ABC-2 type transport system ATP-binding protein